MTEALRYRRARLLGPNMSAFYDDAAHLMGAPSLAPSAMKRLASP